MRWDMGRLRRIFILLGMKWRFSVFKFDNNYSFVR
jgi:hypothetical protein